MNLPGLLGLRSPPTRPIDVEVDRSGTVGMGERQARGYCIGVPNIGAV